MNNCIYFKVRSKNYKKYFYCSKIKKKISFDICKSCKEKEYKSYKPIKKKTSKLAKLENNRRSIFTTNFKKCIECGKTNCIIDKHEIFSGRNRINSIKYDMVIPLCRKCHNDYETIRKWEIKGKSKFIKMYGKDKFIKVFKYLKGVNL